MTEIKLLICTRCYREEKAIPTGLGNAFQDVSPATAFTNEGVIYVVPHDPNCEMLQDGLGQYRKIV